jgi:DNA polymerase IV
VLAASYEVRPFGVHSAMPMAMALRKAPQAIVVPPRMAAYEGASEQIFAILGSVTPLVEPLSLDEAFLDVTGARSLLGTGREIAARIRADVRAELGLGCSVGVAPNKFLAKLASVDAKPVATERGIDPGPGIVEIRAGEERAYLDPLPVQRLWGVGPATLEKLHRLGVERVGDLAAVDGRVLATALGRHQASHLAALARGEDDRPVEPDRAVKSISAEETFAANVHTTDDLRRHLVRLADGVAARLRESGLGARTLTLKLRFDAGFRTITRSVTARDPVATGPEIVAALGPVLDGVDPTPGVRLLGVGGSNLAQPSRQLSLLDDEPAWSGAATAVDAIRERFGAAAIGPGSALDRDGLRVATPGAQQWGPTGGDHRSAE